MKNYLQLFKNSSFLLLNFCTRCLLKIGLRRNRFLVALYYYLHKKLFGGGLLTVVIEGTKISGYASDGGVFLNLMATGVWEETETKLFKKMIRRGMVVADVGANLGYYSLIASRLVGEKGRVYAFEPYSVNYELLQNNIKQNNFRNVTAVPKAVAAKNGRAILYKNPNLGGISLCQDNVLNKSGRTMTETITLDDFFKKDVGNMRLDFLKIDAEGAEGLIINGARKLISCNSDLQILMEFWPFAIRNIGTNPGEMIRSLIKLGFIIQGFGPGNEKLEILNPAKYGPDFEKMGKYDFLCLSMKKN